jgi:hypothetical protein
LERNRLERVLFWVRPPAPPPDGPSAASADSSSNDAPVVVAGLGEKILQGILKGSKKDGTPDAPSKPSVKPSAPSLRTHADVLGKSEGGPGVWAKSPKRSKGEEYQEQVTGVERGAEYKVKDIYFDGYDAKRKVLLDAKDWQGWPPTDNAKLLAQFRIKTREEARKQIKAAPGAKIEWHVSTQEKAQVVKKFMIDNDMDEIITVVHTPKP